MKIPLIGPSNSNYSPAAALQESINCYLESIETAEGKNKFTLRGIPGVHLFKNLTTINASATPVRGLWSGGGRLFVAAGTKFFEVDDTGSLVGSVSTIADDAAHSPVQIFANRNQLFIVASNVAYADGGTGPTQIALPSLAGYASVNPFNTKQLLWEDDAAGSDHFDIGLVGQTITYNGTGYTVASVTNPNLLTVTTAIGVTSHKAWSATVTLNAKTGCFLDGYCIINRPSSWQFNISALWDCSSWDTLDFDIKSGYPDDIAAVWAEPPLLYLLGTETTEIWKNTGNADFPFQRVDGGSAKVGLVATWSPCSINGKLHMLAGGSFGQAAAVRMEGVSPVRVSTHAQEEDWSGNGAFAGEGISYSYFDRGHWFWVINFAGNTHSWVYDATESARLGEPQWHKRASGGAADVFGNYRPWFHTFIPEWGTNGKHIVGDYSSGKLLEMSSDFFDDEGSDIYGVRNMQHLWNGGKRMFMSRIEIEMEQGLVSGANNPPVMSMDFSDDRGHTFHPSPARTLATGAASAYSTRAYLNRCGGFRDRVPRLKIHGQSKIAIIDANADIQMGTR